VGREVRRDAWWTDLMVPDLTFSMLCTYGWVNDFFS
jgi:hypothetical protein